LLPEICLTTWSCSHAQEAFPSPTDRQRSYQQVAQGIGPQFELEYQQLPQARKKGLPFWVMTR
jgi:hypothetical protein